MLMAMERLRVGRPLNFTAVYSAARTPWPPLENGSRKWTTRNAQLLEPFETGLNQLVVSERTLDSSQTDWTSHAPASPQKISIGRVMRLPYSVAPYYSKKSCCVRLVSLLSGSFCLQDHEAVLIPMDVLMEAACQVRCTVYLVPGSSEIYPFLLQSPPEQQITFHLYRQAFLVYRQPTGWPARS